MILIRLLLFPIIFALVMVWAVLYWTVKAVGEIIGQFFLLLIVLGSWAITGRQEAW